jgi:hypothetical protein
MLLVGFKHGYNCLRVRRKVVFAGDLTTLSMLKPAILGKKSFNLTPSSFLVFEISLTPLHMERGGGVFYLKKSVGVRL